MSEQLLSLAAPVGGWLVTYLIHSALLVALAYLVVRRLESQRPQLGDVAWKIALLGALVTSSVQMKTGVSPFGGALAPATAEVSETTTGPVLDADWALMARLASEPAPADTGVEVAAPAVRRRAAVAPATVATFDAVEREAPRVAGANLAPVRTEIVAVERAPLWLAVIVAAWLAGALLFAGALLWGWARLRWMLRRRVPLKGRPAELLDRVAWRAGLRQPIRLSVVQGLDVPIAFGVLEPEIALPARAEMLDEDKLETLLAHECAHLVRRDPGWRLLGAAVRSVFWIQPLNRLVCRRLESCSELCADDWAVAHTDRPLDLARCLTEVAGWLGPRGLGANVPAMARPGSVLGVRVRRLISNDRQRKSSRWFAVAAFAVVVGIAFAAPGASNAAAPVSSMLPTAADAAPSDSPIFGAPAVDTAGDPASDPDRAAAAFRQLVSDTSNRIPVAAIIAQLEGDGLDDDTIDAMIDGALVQWLKGPGHGGDWDWDFDIDFDFDFDVEVDDDDDDNNNDNDQDHDDNTVLDPRDFVEGAGDRTLPGRFGRATPPVPPVPPVPDVDVDVDIDADAIGREIEKRIREQLERAAKDALRDDRCGDEREHAEHMRRHGERMRRHAERMRRHAAKIRARAERLRERHQRRAEHMRERHQRRAERMRRRYQQRSERERQFRSAMEAQRRAIEQAMRARGEALKSAADAREQVERAMREAEKALREAERIRVRLRHRHRRDAGDDDDDDNYDDDDDDDDDNDDDDDEL